MKEQKLNCPTVPETVLFETVLFNYQSLPIELQEEIEVRVPHHCEYKIIPFNVLDKETGQSALSLPAENQTPPFTGAYYILTPEEKNTQVVVDGQLVTKQIRIGETNRTVRLKQAGQTLITRAVQGQGYILRLLPNAALDITYVSPDLKGENPIVTSDQECVVNFISAVFSQEPLIIEGIDFPLPFDPKHEFQLDNIPGSDRPPNPLQILQVGGQDHHLFPFWQAQQILRTGSRELVKACYPQIANL